MKIFLFILLLFFTHCSIGNKYAYMCGERECVDKKEVKEYFEKNISLEVKIPSEKREKTLDLVELNIDSVKEKNELSSKNINQEKLLSLKKKQETKEKLKEEKRLTKLQIKEERKKKKKEKNLLKSKKKKKEKSITKKINQSKLKKNQKRKKDAKKDNKLCILVEKCDIDQISDYLIKIGEQKDYPNINKR